MEYTALLAGEPFSDRPECVDPTLAAILRRDIQGHRRWMSRGYALALGAATQMLVLMVAGIVAGPPNELTHDVLMALSWVITRRTPRGRTTKPTQPSTVQVTVSFSGEHP